MKIVQRLVGRTTVICPQGPVTGSDADQLAGIFAQVLKEEPAGVVLSAETVAFVDSRALEVLMQAGEDLIRAGKVLRIAGANPLVRDVIRLTGLAPLFKFGESAPVAEALA